MRIGGLASGMDTDSMIKEMMAAHRIPLDKIVQQKQYMEYQRDDYRDLNRKMNDFSNLTFDTILRPSTYSQKTISSSSSALSIKSVSATSDVSGSIDVTQVAEAASMRSKSELAGVDPNAKLDPNYDHEANGDKSITIQAIQADGTLGEPQTIDYNPAEETMNTLISKINKTGTVDMFFDSFTGKVSMSAKHTGDAVDANGNDVAEINLIGDFFTNTLKLDEDNVTAANLADPANSNGSIGKNAKFTYNGLETERSSNTFRINGFEFTVNDETNGDVKFSSSPNTENILESIVKFTDEYNKLIAEIKGKTSETKYRDFPPLTDEQRSELTEKEAELWDEKAMSGTLRGDSTLNRALDTMRRDLGSMVGGLAGANRLAEFGITTSKDYRENGKLVIDEAKLRTAITTDPNGIYELFANDSDNPEEKGLGRRLRETISTTREQIIERAGRDTSVGNTFTLGRGISNKDDQIERFEDRLNMMENRYHQQFAAMEAAIQKANQQSTYLMNAFGGGQQM
ncbi:flagellar hook-associated protein 2 [Jeotgalibacillus salarius]|uniref:Flagellar hook-associated protein 2 n=1 Tax=Jeotgalibacillus salarius TaxID=546023 RepID=A0A4Y8LPK4_9BACL|nr:flagellar hook-associated protein 2 [Jeotgalibacillus salarius]TFE03931.1 flagellar hook-associated protein 2 [Jeotgalibacillus salarius]